MDTQIILAMIVIHVIATASHLLVAIGSSNIVDRALYGFAAIGFTLATGFYVAML
jgi:hypothetical protein